jgi:enoyl-CoA hydratase
MLNYDAADGIAVITLNRPEAMNALSKALRAALAEALVKADADPDVSVIILTGAGERAFTAGLDLKELGGDPAAMADANAAAPSANPVKAIEQTKKPIIKTINNITITNGFEVALACDILIASENARFADTHARVGILPGWGLSQKLSRLIGIYRAKELSFSGNYLDARTAEAWGLVNRVVPAAELMTAAKKLAADIATIPSDTVQTYKKLIDDGFAMDFGESLKLETATTSKLNAQVTPESIEQRRLAIQARGRAQA